MDLSNQNQEGEMTNTLAEILGSINTKVSINDVNIVNYIEEEKTNEYETNNININLQETQETQETQEIPNLSTQVQLLTDTIDRRIGNYLLNELEKKQAYIDELEDAVKFQEKEISELKSKLEGINKLELLSKIKSNMETKLVEVETNLHQIEEAEELPGNYEVNSGAPEKNFKPKVVSVKKSNQQTQQVQAQPKVISDEEQTQYPRSNPDLVFRSDPGTKVKSIPKEEEEPRYNGVIMLEKPKNEPVIKIQLDYETETGGDNSSTMSDVVKQRRRRAGRL